MLRETGNLPEQTDVLILGAGMAGHCAALAAAEAGCQVLLLEKAAQAGGSSAMAGGAFAFSGTDLMLEAGQHDTVDAFRADLMKSGKGCNNPVLVDAFLRHQHSAYLFLKKHGVRFELPDSSRMHRTGTGRAVTRLHLAARADDRISFFSKCAAHRLLRSSEGQRVDQAIVSYGDELRTVMARRGIVLATGGFSRSRELLAVFAPELLEAIKHGGVANTGDGLIMATTLGAGLADIGYVAGTFGGAIRDYPRGVQGADEVPPLLFAYLSGAILVNRDAVRFINEGQSYKALGQIGMQQPGGVAFQLFDHKLMMQSVGDSSVNNFNEGLVGGYIQSAGSIAELASKMGLDPGRLENTVGHYNKDVADGVDREFGRSHALLPLDAPPYYIAATSNALTSTYGGVTVNADMAVTDWIGEPILGLFAAGEVAGGFHGAGYYSASSLSSSATFGMQAGRSAAASVG